MEIPLIISALVVGLGLLFRAHLRRPSPTLRRPGDAFTLPSMPLADAVPADGIRFEGRAASGLQVAVREADGVASGYEVALEGFPLDAVLRMRTSAASLVLDRLRPDRILTHDPAFDEAVVVSSETHEAHLRALLDAPTRALLLQAIGTGRVELSGQQARGLAPEVAGDSRLAERLIAQLAVVRRAVTLAPSAVPARLLEIVKTDPIDAVRAACIRALLSAHGATPQSLAAASLAHTVTDLRTRWMAAQALGDAGQPLALSVLVDPQTQAALATDIAQWLTRFDLEAVLSAVGPRLRQVRAPALARLLDQPPSSAAGDMLVEQLPDLDDAQATVIIDALRWARHAVPEHQLIGLLFREAPALFDFAVTVLAEHGTAASFEAMQRLDSDDARAAIDRIRERLQTGGRLSIAAASTGGLSEAD